jgi:hypothetical protein
MQKLTADAFVHADRARDVVTSQPILSHRFAISLMNEPSSRESIGGVLRELRSFERSDHKRRFDQVKRAIEILHDRDRFFVATADHHAIGTHEVVDRAPSLRNSGFETTPKLARVFLRSLISCECVRRFRSARSTS